jgi:hypothetical protein
MHRGTLQREEDQDESCQERVIVKRGEMWKQRWSWRTFQKFDKRAYMFHSEHALWSKLLRPRGHPKEEMSLAFL